MDTFNKPLGPEMGRGVLNYKIAMNGHKLNLKFIKKAETKFGAEIAQSLGKHYQRWS